MAVDRDSLGREALFNLPVTPSVRGATVYFELLDLPALYPLEIEFEVLSAEGVPTRLRFEAFEPGRHRVELPKPAALDRFDSIDIALRASRAVVRPGGSRPVALKRPVVEFHERGPDS